MAIPTLNAIGFCAHYSEQGDWAFDYALNLSRQHNVQLDVFHFLENPYDPTDNSTAYMTREDKIRISIKREKELRMYYDSRAGDFIDVGFRLCEDNEWTELHRCLLIREFQILVLAYIDPDCTFAGKPIEEFANSFISPVVLIGPDSSGQIHINSQAKLISQNLNLNNVKWRETDLVTA